MTSRLPTVGGDNNEWGTVLNDYLAVSHTEEGKNKPLVTSVDYASSITPNVDTTEILTIGALTGNITITNPDGTSINGQLLTLRLSQDSTGGRTLTFGDIYTYDKSTIPTTPSSKWEMSFRYNTTTTKWEDTSVSGEATETTSRTIYVATTGNDTTGNGSITTPYLTPTKALSTIKKQISPGVTVTVHFVAGTYTLSTNDLNTISLFQGAGTLEIEGELTLVDSGFTMGSPEALDPLTYAVSGGNTASWTSNQWKYYFLKNTDYYPITHNTTTTLSIAGANTGTEIYEAKTIINILFTTNIVFNYQISSLVFNRLKINLSAFSFQIFSESKNIAFTECNIIGTSGLIMNAGVFWNIRKTTTNGIYVSINDDQSSLNNNNYLYANINQALLFVNTPNGKLRTFLNNVFENPNTGTSARALGLHGGTFVNNTTSTNYLKFVNTTYCISLGANPIFEIQPIIIIVNSTHLIRKQSSTTPDYQRCYFIHSFSKILGTPNTKYFYDAMYEFTNPASGRNIQITGLIYPEFEQNLSSTLTDNTTTNVIIGNKLQNRSITIEYTITRGMTYEKGRLDILSDGTNLTLQESTPLGDVGVTFTVNFNTNEIRLACALTSTGTSATMKYNATRVMITPLTM